MAAPPCLLVRTTARLPAAAASPALSRHASAAAAPFLAHPPRYRGRVARRVGCCRAEAREEGGALDAPPPAPSTPSQSSSPVLLPDPPFLLIGALAGAGAVETTYLLASKLLGAAVACPTSGCSSVLDSAYGSLGGLPLPALGLLVYGATAAAGMQGAAAASKGAASPDAAATIDRSRWSVLGLSSVLASTSAYLMWVLFAKLGGECLYCYGSAALSATLLGLALLGFRPPELTKAAGVPLGLGAATVLALAVGFGDVGAAGASKVEFIPYEAHAVTTASEPRAVALAKHLKTVGARMYGAFWCSHCLEQKDLLGAEAFAQIDYVECWPGGWQKGGEMAPACKEAGLAGYPTWFINGQKIEGDKSLDELAKLSGFEG